MMNSDELLNQLNQEYLLLHSQYEEAFWLSYMGDKSKDALFTESKKKLEDFKNNSNLYASIIECYDHENNDDIKKRLEHWKGFFELYQIPDELISIRNTIIDLEKKIESNRATRVTGYKDPNTGEFSKMSIGVMRTKMATESNEIVRKALFEGISETLTYDVEDLVTLVKLRNEYAQKLGYKNFYAYKASIEEKMDCEEIRKIFDDLRDGAQKSFDYIRELDQTTMTGVRKPWNFSHMFSGDFIKQEDPYFNIGDSLEKWGRSMMNLGVDYQGCTMSLDLLEREGKYQNGFCHMPIPVHFINGSKMSSKVNFTCDNKPGVIGEGSDLYNTLFHEGGHAAHFANMNCNDIILNTEYPPASTARAETQSMFMDTMLSSIERKTRYIGYSFDLFTEKIKKLRPIAARRMMGICAIVDFERKLYTSSSLNFDQVVMFAKETSDRYFDFDDHYLFALLPVHLYSWESSCSYHGYGLAELGVYQLREYFYSKYGYIVDNPNIGQEMTKRRNVGSSISFQDCIRGLTGSSLSPDAYLSNINKTIDQVIAEGQAKIHKLQTIPFDTQKAITIGSYIQIVDGEEIICNNKESFEKMSKDFKEWINKKS